MMQRTTVSADHDDLETLRAEARHLREMVAEKVEQLREARRPRLGIGHSQHGVSRASGRRRERSGEHTLPALMALVLDIGAMLAALDADDPAHAHCAGLINVCNEPLVAL